MHIYKPMRLDGALWNFLRIIHTTSSQKVPQIFLLGSTNELLVLSILENTGNNDYLNGLGIASQAGPSNVFSSFSPLTCFKLEATTVLSENMERFHQQPLWHEIIWPCTPIVPANVNLSTTRYHIHNRQTCYVQNSCECLNPNPDSINA